MDVNATAAPLVRPGKSGQSVGHLAKAAVAEARANGIDVPKNAQGTAASAIARGADPASVFASRVASEPDAPAEPPVDAEAPADSAETVAPAESEGLEAPAAAAATSYAAAQNVVGDGQMTGEETALRLLQG